MADITASTFVLAVNDLDASRKFYCEKLGFSEDFSAEGWSFLSRGACKLRIGQCPDAQPISQCQDHSWFAYLHVRDASGLYQEFAQRKVEIWHKLEDKPWRMREFAVAAERGGVYSAVRRVQHFMKLTSADVDVPRVFDCRGTRTMPRRSAPDARHCD
jgi:catechol 2,3-dioxygenase-like lactoylglutathione lyase family enzyme